MPTDRDGRQNGGYTDGYRFQGAARLGERVLDVDRNFGVDGAAHEPLPFEPAESNKRR